MTLFDPKLQVFKNSPHCTTQNVSLSRFARNVERDFICDFQTPCMHLYQQTFLSMPGLYINEKRSNRARKRHAYLHTKDICTIS